MAHCYWSSLKECVKLKNSSKECVKLKNKKIWMT